MLSLSNIMTRYLFNNDYGICECTSYVFCCSSAEKQEIKLKTKKLYTDEVVDMYQRNMIDNTKPLISLNFSIRDES